MKPPKPKPGQVWDRHGKLREVLELVRRSVVWCSLWKGFADGTVVRGPESTVGMVTWNRWATDATLVEDQRRG